MREARLRKLALWLAPAVLFFSVAVAVYWGGLEEIPRWDELFYLKESALFPDTVEWLLHSLSSSRTRILYAGDAFLFRPIHFAVLFAVDRFIPRVDLLTIGLVSVALLTFAALAMYRFTRRLLPAPFALLAGLLIVVEYPGSALVTYHHISPYLVSMGCLMLALGAILDRRDYHGSGNWKAATLLFIASLSHEMVPLGLAVAIITILLLSAIGTLNRETRQEIRQTCLWLAAPLAAFVLLDVIDAVFRGKAILALGPADSTSAALEWGLASFQCIGAFLIATVAPSLVHRYEIDILHPPLFDPFFSATPIVLPIASLLFIMMLAAVPLLAYRTLASRELRSWSIALVINWGTLVALLAGVLIGRGALRSPGYLAVSTWYLGMGQFLLVGLILLLFHLALWRQKSNGRIAMLAKASPVVIAVILIVSNAAALRAAVASYREMSAPARQLVQTLHVSLKRLGTGYCYAGVDPSSYRFISDHFGLAAWTLQATLERADCRSSVGGLSLYLHAEPNGALLLGALEPFASPIAGATLEVHPVDIRLPSPIIVDSQRLLSPTLFLTDAGAATAPIVVSRIPIGRIGAILTGFCDARSFSLLVFDRASVYFRTVKDGVLGPMENEALLPVGSSSRLTIIHTPTKDTLLSNNYILTESRTTSACSDRIGYWGFSTYRSTSLSSEVIPKLQIINTHLPATPPLHPIINITGEWADAASNVDR
jgi:hypothetical protein